MNGYCSRHRRGHSLSCVQGISVPPKLVGLCSTPYFFIMSITLHSYRDSIISLPLEEHSFITKRSTWLRAETSSPRYRAINDRIFNNDLSIELNRNDLFKANTGSIEKYIFKVLYWGYPYGMRGLSLQNLTGEKNLARLIGIVKELKKEKKDRRLQLCKKQVPGYRRHWTVYLLQVTSLHGKYHRGMPMFDPRSPAYQCIPEKGIQGV